MAGIKTQLGFPPRTVTKIQARAKQENPDSVPARRTLQNSSDQPLDPHTTCGLKAPEAAAVAPTPASTTALWLGLDHILLSSSESIIRMSCPQTEEKLPYEELECKICYQKFNVYSRKPKILDCLHRVCARCLTKIAHAGDGTTTCISCPFCRFDTEMQEEKVAGLPDDTNIMSKLLLKDKTTWNSDSSEVVLTPKNLVSSSPSHGFSNCLVITLMEVQSNWTRTPSQNTISDDYGGHSLDSVSGLQHTRLRAGPVIRKT
ncbi:E3 ubiquitin-protein ligase RNF182-like isoform X2 [Petaurus breviceps papuanus]|uniref:E3 ubiquitin-protein ligase RNF182-like isoform X2 n=1 Tax=Petaurus breviceps papuanus TaxID=3040969 RepID=UPI0036DD1064